MVFLKRTIIVFMLLLVASGCAESTVPTVESTVAVPKNEELPEEPTIVPTALSEHVPDSTAVPSATADIQNQTEVWPESQRAGDPVGALNLLAQQESERHLPAKATQLASSGTVAIPFSITHPGPGWYIPRNSEVLFEGDPSGTLICWDGAKEPLDESLNYYADTPAMLRYLYGRCDQLTAGYRVNDAGGWAILWPETFQPRLYFSVGD